MARSEKHPVEHIATGTLIFGALYALYRYIKGNIKPTVCQSCSKEYPLNKLEKCSKCEILTCKDCFKEAPIFFYDPSINFFRRICNRCMESLDQTRIKKYTEALEGASQVKEYSANYKGKNHLKNAEAGPRIYTSSYQDRDDALFSAKMIALMDGYSLLDEVEFNRYSDSEPTASGGIHYYTTFVCTAVPYRKKS